MMEQQRLREVVQIILDQPVPERVKRRLLKSVRPSQGRNRPFAPLKWRRKTSMTALLEEPDPSPSHGNPTVTNYQNELMRI